MFSLNLTLTCPKSNEKLPTIEPKNDQSYG